MYVHLLLKRRRRRREEREEKKITLPTVTHNYQDRAPLTIEYAKTPIPMESSGIRPEAGE